MFYLTKIDDYVRVEPRLFGLATKDAVREQLKETYADYISKEIGKVITVVEISDVGEGIIIPGDGAAYYKSRFKVLAWKPELQELSFGIVDEITNFGAFVSLGGMRGMVHISQAMDDYVSFSKSNTLQGKKSNKSLKAGDECLTRVVAISYKKDRPTIGLTMRQPGLGNLKWIEAEKKKLKQEKKKEKKNEKKK